MDKPSISLGITVYANPDRLARLLHNLEWSGIPASLKIRVFEDPHDDVSSTRYRELCRQHNVSYYRMPSWGCMHKIGQFAVMNSPEDWFIYMPDDILVTKGYLQNIIDIISKYKDSSAGLFQVPYWNAHEYTPGWPGGNYKYLWQCSPESMLNFLASVPENDYWSKTKPRPYINVNGVGFVLRRQLWGEVGGFSPETWSLDEDISVRCWMYSRYNIFTMPGAPCIHLFGGTSQDGTQPKHQFHTMESWIKAWGADKTGIGSLCYDAQKTLGKFTHDIDTLPMREKAYFFDEANTDRINAVMAATKSFRDSR